MATLTTNGPVNAIGIRAKNSGQRYVALSSRNTTDTDRLMAAIRLKSCCLRWMT